MEHVRRGEVGRKILSNAICHIVTSIKTAGMAGNSKKERRRG